MGAAIEHRFLIVAGEASGDHHAAGVVRCLQSLGPCRVPRRRRSGARRRRSRARGGHVRARGARLLGRAGAAASPVARVIIDCWMRAMSFRPDAAILIDSPGFNLRLGPELKRRGVRVFYYIAPQVWAWRAGRARAMSHWVDRLAVVFPFELPLFREAGVPTEFVGHPLLDELAPEVDERALRAELGAGPGDRILGLLPGSRAQEVHCHLPVLLEAARRLRAGRPDLKVAIPIAPGLSADELRQAGGLSDHLSDSVPNGVRFVQGRTRAVEAFATACAVASGTASLETALFGTPLVVVYRTGWLNYEIARRLVTLKQIALPNIVAGASVAPELIQDALTAERLSAHLVPLLDEEVRATSRAGLAVVRERLGTPGAACRTAALVRELVA